MTQGVSTFSAVCVSVNMMIGAGFLAFPSGFYGGGILASTIVVAAVCYLMVITCTWEGRCVIHSSRILKSGRKIPEVTEAFFVFCGQVWRDVYVVVLMISFLSCSWVLAILFAHTMSSSIPSIYHPEQICSSGDDNVICDTRYLLNMAILFVITTPLALMDIGEQWWIQNSLAAVRVIRMLLMCITPMLAYSDSGMAASFPVSYHPSAVAQPALIFGTWNGLAHVLSAAVFSQYLNASIPIIIDSLEDRNNFMRVMHYTFGICLCLYIWLSVVVTNQFGSDTLNPCNINWTGYRWPFCADAPPGSLCDLSARCVEFIVVFCPAVDVASAFPFIGIVLGNSLTEIVLGTPPLEGDNRTSGSQHTDALVTPSPQSEADTSAPSETVSKLTLAQYKFFNKVFRFFTNTLPMVLAISITNFSLVIQITGGISVLICLVFPAFLSLRCSSYMDEHMSAHQEEGGGESYSYWGDGPLSWVDGVMAVTDSGGGNVRHYGAIPLETHSGRKHSGGRGGHAGEEIIERSWFKEGFLWVGIAVTGLILYISIQE